MAIHRGVAEGGKGTVDLANVVAEACDDVSELKFTYDLEDSLETKLEKVATKVYGADGISIAPAAAKQLKRFADLGYGNLPVVIAKTHLSISSDASLKGAPTVGLCRCVRFVWQLVPVTCTQFAVRCALCLG